MKIFTRKKLAVQIAIAIGALSAATSGVVLAQTVTTPSVAAGTTAVSGVKTALDEIVVTAQRRAENKQEVPVSVTAVTAEQLADRNITDITQMEGMSPGFTFGRSGSDARPAMRGVRTENVAINGDTTIGYFIDGIYKSRAQQALASFVDVERVEIQRGPQGTLYGRNTFGGNISVLTNAPVFKKFQGSASAQFGEFNKTRFEGMVNLPVHDMFAVRVAAAYDKSDGYVQNDFNSAADLFDQDLKYGRLALKFQPNSAFEATFRTDSTEQGGNGGSAFGYKQAGTYYGGYRCGCWCANLCGWQRLSCGQ